MPDNPSVSLAADSSPYPQGARHIRKAAQPPTAMLYTGEPRIRRIPENSGQRREATWGLPYGCKRTFGRPCRDRRPYRRIPQPYITKTGPLQLQRPCFCAYLFKKPEISAMSCPSFSSKSQALPMIRRWGWPVQASMILSSRAAASSTVSVRAALLAVV